MAKRRILFFPQPSERILLTRSAAQVITNNTVTKVTFDTVLDVMGGFVFNAATNDITVSATGLCWLSASIRWTANATGIRTIQFLRNGVIMHVMSVPAGGATPLSGEIASALVSLTAGDVIGLNVYQSSGANSSVLMLANNYPLFGLVKLND